TLNGCLSNKGLKGISFVNNSRRTRKTITQHVVLKEPPLKSCFTSYSYKEINHKRSQGWYDVFAYTRLFHPVDESPAGLICVSQWMMYQRSSQSSSSNSTAGKSHLPSVQETVFFNVDSTTKLLSFFGDDQ
ncbi:unnamed protein product, partial [Brassica rapa]